MTVERRLGFSHYLVRANESGAALPFFTRGARPIVVEIGFGDGEFLQGLAEANPDALVVGFELSRWCIDKAVRRLGARGVENARIVCGDARFLIPRLFAPASVRRVCMNYPCPWPKRRHAERRVATDDFARLLEHALETGGVFELTTDVDWYAEATRDYLERRSAFETDPVQVGHGLDPAGGTKYERNWREQGKALFRVVARKVGEINIKNEKIFARDEGADEMTEEMREVSADRSLEAILASLRGAEGRTAGGFWVLRQAFAEARKSAPVENERVGLVQAIANDEGFEQHFYVKIVCREVSGGSHFRVKLDSIGHPYRTRSVRAALRRVLDAASTANDGGVAAAD